MKTHIDYSSAADHRLWHINRTGGPAGENLTVRDVFAVQAMHALVDHFVDKEALARRAFETADAMMRERELDRRGAE